MSRFACHLWIRGKKIKKDKVRSSMKLNFLGHLCVLYISIIQVEQ